MFWQKETLTALGPLLLTVVVGMTLGYSAVLLPQLQTPNNGTNTTITINQEEASWVASLAVLPMVAGTLLGGFLIEHYGRKRTHIITCFPYIVGWWLIYFAKNLEVLLIGRFVTGLCSGVLAPATGVYIGETTEPKNRGVLLGGISLSISVGLLVVHTVGTFLTWQTTALVTSSLPIISWLLMIVTPESPAWFARKGFTEKAQKSFYWLRGCTEEAKQELEVILAKQKNVDTSISQGSLRDKLCGLLRPEFYKPMTILLVLFVTSQWAGVNAVNFYSVTLMKRTLEDGVNEYLATFIVDCIRLVASVVACILLRRIGRRQLALFSGVGTFVPLFILSGFLFFTKTITTTQNSIFMVLTPIGSLVTYVFFVTAGFVTLPWNLLGELLPLSTRSLGSAIASSVAYLSIFLVVKTMPEMFDNLGPHGTFLVYGIMGFLGTLFVFLYLPETRGKTLHEIEEYFKGKKNPGTTKEDC